MHGSLCFLKDRTDHGIQVTSSAWFSRVGCPVTHLVYKVLSTVSSSHRPKFSVAEVPSYLKLAAEYGCAPLALPSNGATPTYGTGCALNSFNRYPNGCTATFACANGYAVMGSVTKATCNATAQTFNVTTWSCGGG